MDVGEIDARSSRLPGHAVGDTEREMGEETMGRAAFYIDGFNLFYGSLKQTRYKWLDLEAMCRRLLPDDDLVAIHYFTARVSVIGDDQVPRLRQQIYLRALGTLPLVTVHFGHFLTHPVRRPLVSPPQRGSRFAEVYRTEEKGSDVNLATEMLMGGFRGSYDTAVVVSNDSDLATPIHRVKHDLGHRVGVVNPQRRGKRSGKLTAMQPDFHLQLNQSVVQHSQLPDPLTDAAGRKIHKPQGW